MIGSGQLRIHITPMTFNTSITIRRVKKYPLSVSVPQQFALQL